MKASILAGRHCRATTTVETHQQSACSVLLFVTRVRISTKMSIFLRLPTETMKPGATMKQLSKTLRDDTCLLSVVASYMHSPHNISAVFLHGLWGDGHFPPGRFNHVRFPLGHYLRPDIFPARFQRRRTFPPCLNATQNT